MTAADADPEMTLAELRRVLRPGGRLALTCWVLPVTGFMGILPEAMQVAGVDWPDDIPDPPLTDHANLPALGPLIAGADFADVEVAELSWELDVDLEQWWDDGAASRVGSNGVVIGRQDPGMVARIKTEFLRISRLRYGSGEGRAAFPAHALLACAVRPA